MKMFKKVILIASVLLGVESFAETGDKGGNGGFLYSRTSKKLLDEAQQSLGRDLVGMQRDNQDYISAICAKIINLQEMKNIVDDLQVDYVESTSAVNTEGREEERSFEVRDGKVVATPVYFSAFVDTYFRYSEETDLVAKDRMIAPVRESIIHEALHLFHYNEMEARACAPDLIQQIERYDARRETVAMDKKVEEVIASCEELKHIDRESTVSLASAGIRMSGLGAANRLFRCLVEQHQVKWQLSGSSSEAVIQKLVIPYYRGVGTKESFAKKLNETFIFNFELGYSQD